MNPKILLIHPWIYDFAAYDLWIKPLGLLSIAARLRQYGLQVRFLDCLAENVDLGLSGRSGIKRHPYGHGKMHKEKIAKPSCLTGIRRHYHRYGLSPADVRSCLRLWRDSDAVFITSMMTYWYPGVWELIEMVRRDLPGVPIVLGGVYASICPNHASLSGADHIIIGPAEPALNALLKELFGRAVSLLPIAGNLDVPSSPAYDLIDVKNTVPILTSRGCPCHCTYCASSILHPRFTQRDPELVVEEIVHLYHNYGVTQFAFYDDALLAQSDKMIRPMLKALIGMKLPCQFHCPNGLHLREMDKEMACLLRLAGFRTLRFGLETADETRQKQTGAKVNCDQFKVAVNSLLDAGFTPEDIGVYLLIGLPDQSSEEVTESIRFVIENGARPILAEYSPIPGTALWAQALVSSPYPLATEPLFHNNTLLPCRHPELTDNKIQELKDLARSAFPSCLDQKKKL